MSDESAPTPHSSLITQHSSLRVALGPLGHPGAESVLARLPGFEVLTVGPAGADVPFDHAADDFAAVWSRLPNGWRPDLLLWSTPEYGPYPAGLEACPCPTVALVGDWNLAFSALRGVLDVFDRVYTDRAGVDAFRRAGFEQVEYWPMFSFRPDVHRPLGLEQTYDVTFIGNFNHDVQHERSFWLRRLARLADRYGIRLLTDVRGEEYARVLNQSKIVFNRSIRGEMNMRAYEAPACGSLLFIERENLEVGEYLRDGEECVLYGDDLEELIGRYLADDAARERIARAGHARIQAQGHIDHWRRLAEDLTVRPPRADRRRWLALSPAEQRFRYGLLAAQSAKAEAFAAAERAFKDALTLGFPPVACLNALGVLYGDIATGNRGEMRRKLLLIAAQNLTAAVEVAPHPVVCRNLGTVAAELGDTAAAERWLNVAARGLRAADPGEDLAAWAIHYPRAYDRFRVEWERAAAAGDPATGPRLLRWRTHDQLGDLALAAGMLGIARHHYEAALAAWPDQAPTQKKRARLLVELGETESALEAYRLAVEDGPFDFEALAGLAGLLLGLGRREECRAVCREALTLIEACPSYEGWRRQFTELGGMG